MFPAQLTTLWEETHYLCTWQWHAVCSYLTVVLGGHQLAQHTISSTKCCQSALNLETTLFPAFTLSLLRWVEGLWRPETTKHWEKWKHPVYWKANWRSARRCFPHCGSCSIRTINLASQGQHCKWIEIGLKRKYQSMLHTVLGKFVLAT